MLFFSLIYLESLLIKPLLIISFHNTTPSSFWFLVNSQILAPIAADYWLSHVALFYDPIAHRPQRSHFLSDTGFLEFFLPLIPSAKTDLT